MVEKRIIARAVLVAVCGIILSGCASQVVQSQYYKSYSVGVERTATIGDSFLVDQSGSIEIVRRWVGVLNSPDGWKETKVYSQDFVRRELIYGGRSGATIDVSYREFRGGYAAPAFYQAMKYDLSSSSQIRFQNFKIDVRQADNEKIVYRVLSDH